MYLKKKLIWDTSLDDHQYPEEIKKVLFKNYLTLRKEYTNWIGQISKKFSKDVDWWASIPSSRNPNFTKIYKIICLLETLKKVEEKIIEVKTDSKLFFDLVKKHFSKKKIKFSLIKKKNNNNLSKFLIGSIFQLMIFFVIKISYCKKISKNNNTFINNYPTYNLEKIERHFQFSNSFFKKNYKKFYFVPNIIPHKNFFKVLKLLKICSKRNYFFKESLLTIKDLFFAFTYPLRIKKFNTNFKKYKRYNLSKIVFSEISNLRYFAATLHGILNYKFTERLFLKKYNVKKTVCWQENHEQKGWNYGFRKFFPMADVYGYQGFTNLPQLMNTIPADFEEKFKVIPKKIIVSGREYKAPRKEFFSKLKIQVGPSFIYNKIHNKFKKKNKIKYLVILTEILHINLSILNWLKYAIDKDNKNFFYVKKPKILNMDNHIDSLNIKKNIIFCNGSLVEFFKKSYCVITSGPTGATIEALGYNCKLLIPLIDAYDEIYLKIIKVPKKMYKISRNKDIFLKNLKSVKLIKNPGKLNSSLLRNLFEKVSQKNQNIFI